MIPRADLELPKPNARGAELGQFTQPSAAEAATAPLQIDSPIPSPPQLASHGPTGDKPSQIDWPPTD